MYTECTNFVHIIGYVYIIPYVYICIHTQYVCVYIIISYVYIRSKMALCNLQQA